MNKNENTKEHAKAATDLKTPPRPFDRDSLEKTPGSALLEGRIEKRVKMTVPVDLVTAEGQLITERVITVNVSPHGARVLTKRHWQTAERPWLSSLTSYMRLQGSVVYCQPLSNGEFCVGLKFLASLKDFGDNFWR
jgi:hypothetical protein